MMSSMTKNVQAVDNSVAERRLRPIYDWLDGGNNKKALQECEKVLKKSPKLQCARALKALSLHRMGKDNEAIEIVDVLTEEKPTDEPTLQALTLCCREMKKLERICKLYESAAKLDPANEEIQTQLFMSFVRVGDFKQQQMVAMSLYKHWPKNPYYCWAVMSVILQATRGEGVADPNKRKLLLSLAERMMLKLIQESKLEAEQEMQLYMMILEQQGRHDQVLELIGGPLSAKLTCVNLPELRLKYNRQLEKWAEVNVLCKSILSENMDRWDVWLQYIESVFKCPSGAAAQPLVEGETVDDSPEKAHEFICRIVESCGMRGPYLARFELYAKLKAANEPGSELLGDPNSLFIEYFRKFGHKPCYVSDLRQYLVLLDADGRADLSDKLLKEVQQVESLEEMQRHICALQMSRLCGMHASLSEQAKKELVEDLVARYHRGYERFGSDLLSTDLGPSDPYILLAVHLLNDLGHECRNSDYFLAALVLINMLLKNSPSNFHAKLLGVRLNHLVGNVSGAQDMYASLDVKHLQLDSLGYAHCLRLATSASYSACANLFASTIYFFDSNYKDSSDHLTLSYKFGSFVKLDEFMDFRERLRDSIHYATVELERIFLAIVTEGQFQLANSLTERNYDSLQNNYDLQVYASWNPDRVHHPPERSPQCAKFIEATRLFLKIRAKTLGCINAATQAAHSQDSDRPQKLHEFANALQQWRRLEEEAKNQHWDLDTQQINIPQPSRLSAYVKVPFFDAISKLLQIFVAICSDDATNNHLDELKSTLSQLSKETFESSNVNYLPERRFTLELVVNHTELISVATMILEMCSELTRKQSTTAGKKSKKKSPTGSSGGGGGSVNNETTKTAVNLVLDSANSLLDGLEKWNAHCVSEQVIQLMEQLKLLNVETSNWDTLKNSVADSYVNSTVEIRTVLKNKIKQLSALG